MTFVYEGFILLIRTEARVNTIVVGCGVAVVSTVFTIIGRAIILQYRGEPEGSNTKVSEVIEVLAESFKVASVSKTWLIAVAELVFHPFDYVILWVTISKAIRHQHIQNIRYIEALTIRPSHLSCL